MNQINLSKVLIDMIESISDVEIRAKIYTSVFQYYFNDSLPQLDSFSLMAWNLIQPHLPKKNNKIIKSIRKKHLFKHSEYFEFDKFTEAFTKTKCFARHPNLDLERIHTMMVNSEAKNYMYVNWIMATENWVDRDPSKYIKTIKSVIEQDPLFSVMTKGDIKRAEHEAKMALQRKLINNGNDPYSY